MFFEQLNEGYCRTYLVASEKAREAALITRVLERVDDYLGYLDRKGWRLSFIVDTHTHADHISGGPALCDHTGAAYAMHELARPHSPTYRVRDGDSIDVGDVRIDLLHTPGHTNDSLTLVLPDRLLTGDFLFIGEGGAGRTDLPTGDPGEHFDSLQKLKGLDDRLTVLPAHDYNGKWESTLGEERRRNPRLGFTSRDDYVRWLTSQAAPTEEWMLGIVQANYACARDPGAAWRPVDATACVVDGPPSLGVDGQPVRSIDVEEAKASIDGASPLVIDVRGWEEYVGELGHIEGSILIPLRELAGRLGEVEPSRERIIITICRSGGRSHTAAGVLMQAGFSNVAGAMGGMTRWNELGFPTVR